MLIYNKYNVIKSRTYLPLHGGWWLIDRCRWRVFRGRDGMVVMVVMMRMSAGVERLFYVERSSTLDITLNRVCKTLIGFLRFQCFSNMVMYNNMQLMVSHIIIIIVVIVEFVVVESTRKVMTRLHELYLYFMYISSNYYCFAKK